MTTAVTRERMISFLRESPMFEKLDTAEIQQVIHIVEVQSFPAGEIVFQEGEPGDAWYVVYKGEVEVLKNSEDGEEVISVLSPPACFGEMAVLEGLPRSATIRASQNTLVFRVPRTAFYELLENCDPVAYKLLYHMAIVLAHRQRSATVKLMKLLQARECAEFHESIRQIVGESAIRE